MEKKYLIIFSSDERYDLAAKRLMLQAEDSKWFDEIICYSEYNKLNNYKPKCFINGFSKINPRGAGLWAWKPDFIYHCMINEIEENALVVYLDAGVEINKFGYKKFELYCKIANEGKIVATRTNKIEFLYTNIPLVSRIKLGIIDLLSYQYQAGLLVFSNTINNKKLIKLWKELCLENEGIFLLKPSPLHGIIGENRHDQSIFSGILKLSKQEYSIGRSLAENPVLISKSRYMKTYPFFSLRNYTENSIISNNVEIAAKDSFISILDYYLLKIYNKIFKIRK
jgi:hypothetical protein